jgi:hypothetical protein
MAAAALMLAPLLLLLKLSLVSNSCHTAGPTAILLAVAMAGPLLGKVCMYDVLASKIVGIVEETVPMMQEPAVLEQLMKILGENPGCQLLAPCLTACLRLQAVQHPLPLTDGH